MSSSNSLTATRPRIRYGTNEYIFSCGYAGIIAAGGTHFLATPLDVIKCRMQTNPVKYPYLTAGIRTTIVEEGFRGLTRGGAPCLLGYGSKGFFKFGFYEFFKMKFCNVAGSDIFQNYRPLLLLAAAASAELIGDVILSPFEAVKVRIQTDPHAPRYAIRCAPIIYREKGITGFFKGLPPLAFRQVPFTCTQLISFEFIMEALYKYIVPKPRTSCSKAEQMAWSGLGSAFGGILATIFSHQPDIIVSILNKNPKLSYREAFG